MAYPYSYFGSLQHLTGSLPALQRRNLETALKIVLGNGFETVRLTAQQTKLFFSTGRREHKALISQPLPQHPVGEPFRAHYVPPTKEGDRLGSQLDCWRPYPSANKLSTASSHLARTEITNRSSFSSPGQSRVGRSFLSHRSTAACTTLRRCVWTRIYHC